MRANVTLTPFDGNISENLEDVNFYFGGHMIGITKREPNGVLVSKRFWGYLEAVHASIDGMTFRAYGAEGFAYTIGVVPLGKRAEEKENE